MLLRFDDSHRETKRHRPGYSPSPRKKEQLTRNFDSGVFLEDEEGLPEDGDIQQPTEEEDFQILSSQHFDDPGLFEGPVWPYWQPQPKDQKDLDWYHQSQWRANARVGRSIDDGSMEVDLSNLDLEEIRSPYLRPLRYVTRVVPQTDEYDELEARLDLYLSNNRLREIPNEIYHLSKISTLSLRGNEIREILPAIGNLTNLRELNLGCNKLQYLPWELFCLVRQTLKDDADAEDPERVPKFNLNPNPFLRFVVF